ncbi:hypothetical protein L210DRAFT_444089 [Boletus edulis BED1]|uniref:Uncharacterized protein n=1 Tax=Boletus edulis BED1 TaxID=1328754 RepID=A0AAD4GF89_BOLED|nr:hypothetical protein L210DRAFT_444089 [Boletus edulis BED1]
MRTHAWISYCLIIGCVEICYFVRIPSASCALVLLIFIFFDTPFDTPCSFVFSTSFVTHDHLTTLIHNMISTWKTV